MKFQDALKTGDEGWAFRLSGDNLVVAQPKYAFIYTSEEHFKIQDYRPDNNKDWMPLPKCPKYIPGDQNHKWYRAVYRKFRVEELNDRIGDLEKIIKEIEIDKQST